MRRVRGTRRLAAGLAAAGLAGAAFVPGPARTTAAAEQDERALARRPAPPAPDAAQRALARTLVAGETRYAHARALPPRPGDRPATTPDRALAATRGNPRVQPGVHEGGGPPRVVLARYSRLRDRTLTDRLAWLVTFPHAVVPLSGGPAGSVPQVVRCPYVVVLDAGSLALLETFQQCDPPLSG